jgi:hypothetical protein
MSIGLYTFIVDERILPDGGISQRDTTRVLLERVVGCLVNYNQDGGENKSRIGDREPHEPGRFVDCGRLGVLA